MINWQNLLLFLIMRNLFNMEEESNKEMLLEFRETAEKLKKVTAILKSSGMVWKSWKTIRTLYSTFIYS